MSCVYKRTDGFRQSAFCDVTGENIDMSCLCDASFADCPNYLKTGGVTGDNISDYKSNFKTLAVVELGACNRNINRFKPWQIFNFVR